MRNLFVLSMAALVLGACAGAQPKSKAFSVPNAFTQGVEGPACDAKGNLYAVSFDHDGSIGIVTPDGKASLFVDLPKGSTGNGIRFDAKGDMLIADYTGHNVLRVDMKAKKISVYAHEPRMNQPNDIAIARDGRLYASDPKWADNTGQLWRVDTDGKAKLLEDKMGTTNGVEVSPDEKILYVNEGVQRRVWAYDLKDGQISNKRLLIEFPDYGLDGMRCDTAGNLWIARYGKGTIVKLSPQGKVLSEQKLIGSKVTNIAFGGPDGRTAYVTLQDTGIETFRTDGEGREWGMWAVPHSTESLP